MSLISSLCAAVAVGLLATIGYDLWIALTTAYMQDLIKECDAISLDLSKRNFYLNMVGIAILTDVVFIGLTLKSPFLAAAILLLLVVIPRQVVAQLIKSRKRLLKDQMVDAVSMIVSSVRASMTLEAAIEYAANEVPAPLGNELTNVAGAIRLGSSLKDALNNAKERLRIQEFIAFAATLIVNQESGGDRLLPTLEDIKSSLMENRRLERKVESETATGRFVINALCSTPAIFTLISFVTNPLGTKLLFATTGGQLIILVVTILSYVGFVVGQKIVNIEI